MMSVYKIVGDIVRRQFLSGVLVVVPLILTYVVLRFLFEVVDGVLLPIVEKILGYNVPGLGIITTLLIILLTGFFTRSLLGGSIYKRGDLLLTRIPIIRIIYLAAKQLIQAISMPNINSFKEVVLIEYPRRGLYVIGFATSRIRFDDNKIGNQKLVGIFVPSTPTPVTGLVVFAPEDDIKKVDLSVEEALKLLVSGGIVAPSSFGGDNKKERIEVYSEGVDKSHVTG